MDSFSGLSSGLPGPRPVASSISHSSMISICNHAFQQIATSRLKTTEETKSLDPLIYGVGRLSMLRTVLFSRRLLLPNGTPVSLAPQSYAHGLFSYLYHVTADCRMYRKFSFPSDHRTLHCLVSCLALDYTPWSCQLV